ncbi:MAG: gamma-glutamyltransferase [Alphaproteobacteria bacterium]
MRSTSETRRLPVAGRNGAVAAGSQAAADAGAAVLADGGNAVDAIIAAALMAYVVEPGMAGLAGHGRMAIYWAATGTTTAIDHFIRAPALATPDRYREALERAGGDVRAIHHAGVLSVGVFGTAVGLAAAHDHFATRDLAALAAPAVARARDGIPVDLDVQQGIIGRQAELEHHALARDFLMPGGRLPALSDGLGGGGRLDGRDLAGTLERFGKNGASAVHAGAVADAIDRLMRREGGLLRADDLARYTPAIGEDPRYRFAGGEISTCGDLIAVETLNILSALDLAGHAAGSAGALHLFAEAQALAFADSYAHAGDPADGATPMAGLTSAAYGRERAALVRNDAALGHYDPGDPWVHEGRPPPVLPEKSGRPAALVGTTRLCAADREGNVVTFITSLGSSFGSLVRVPGTGLFPGNAMKWFDPRPGRINSVAPGRMPVYGAPALIAYRAGRACGAIAGAGGFRIQSAVLQTLLNHVVHGQDLQAAVESPRIFHDGSRLELDGRAGPHVAAALAALGHDLVVVPEVVGRRAFARPAAVWRDDDGLFHAASDPVAGGAAVI